MPPALDLYIRTTLAHPQATPPSFIMETLRGQHASCRCPSGPLFSLWPPQGMRNPWERW